MKGDTPGLEGTRNHLVAWFQLASQQVAGAINWVLVFPYRMPMDARNKVHAAVRDIDIVHR